MCDLVVDVVDIDPSTKVARLKPDSDSGPWRVETNGSTGPVEKKVPSGYD